VGLGRGRHVGIDARPVFAAAVERRKRHALAVARAIRPRRELARARRNGLLPFRLRHDLVDEPPVDGFLPAHALLGRAEHVGEVAPYLALSVTRVSPPVPGSTASSGVSGSATVERRPPTSMM